MFSLIDCRVENKMPCISEDGFWNRQTRHQLPPAELTLESITTRLMNDHDKNAKAPKFGVLVSGEEGRTLL
ncbi:hypothetical protein Y032_0169g213 [Ancylostoma ceylanicum]|uniref:Uncharacterized protein n=1 Tax=Ancylostoma ceylanicum TaxID=53326 RepID=A0A016SW34_9BILA|nr:hypothetical protein Y032_0169g213 [Ancylostoma ceylanicum]